MFSRILNAFISLCVKTVILFVLIYALPNHFSYYGSSGLLLGFVLAWMFISSVIVPIVGFILIPVKILTLGLASFLINVILFLLFAWSLNFIGFSVLTTVGYIILLVMFSLNFVKGK